MFPKQANTYLDPLLGFEETNIEHSHKLKVKISAVCLKGLDKEDRAKNGKKEGVAGRQINGTLETDKACSMWSLLKSEVLVPPLYSKIYFLLLCVLFGL